MLKINNITKKYKKGEVVFTALEDLSFHVEKGDFIAVVGASGSENLLCCTRLVD